MFPEDPLSDWVSHREVRTVAGFAATQSVRVRMPRRWRPGTRRGRAIATGTVSNETRSYALGMSRQLVRLAAYQLSNGDDCPTTPPWRCVTIRQRADTSEPRRRRIDYE